MTRGERISRGEIWWIDAETKVSDGVPYGSEPGYKRPVLVMQNDLFNNSKINTTYVQLKPEISEEIFRILAA